MLPTIRKNMKKHTIQRKLFKENRIYINRCFLALDEWWTVKFQILVYRANFDI